MMRKKSFIQSDTAVSEALGFIIILSIIMLSMTALWASSGPIIETLQTGTHFQEMANSFKILHKNINRVAFDEAPSRISELIMKDGTMTVSQVSTFTINGTTYNMGSIAYYLDENSVAYEGGGLWTKYGDNSVMQYAPGISISNNTPVIIVVRTSGNTSIGGEGLVRISISSRVGTQIPSTTTNTTVVVHSEYYKAWERYFKDTLGLSSTTNNSTAQTVTADFADIGATRMIYKEKVISARVL
ncbi:MAG: hypothetical protein KAH86_03825 [Methanosarcinales archaeon]|nr:hypothetical protein [Methanosarcinales archaeon]